MSELLILERTREVTRREILTMVNWFEAVQLGLFSHAQAIFQTGFDAEHHIALLPLRPEDITDAMKANDARLLADFNEALRRFNDAKEQARKDREDLFDRRDGPRDL